MESVLQKWFGQNWVAINWLLSTAAGILGFVAICLGILFAHFLIRARNIENLDDKVKIKKKAWSCLYLAFLAAAFPVAYPTALAIADGMGVGNIFEGPKSLYLVKELWVLLVV